MPAAYTPAGAPAPDPVAVADSLRRATLPESPRQVAFGWSLDEAGTKLQGRGVARYEAPERIRVDLFGPRGETYLSAALVGDSIRLPAGVAPSITLPSPALLWAAVGVVRPPTGSVPVAAHRTENSISVRYGGGSEGFAYEADQAGLSALQRLKGSTRVESVQLVRDGGTLQRAEYRDWGALRTLVLTVESSNPVAAFPNTIWLQPNARP